MILADAIAWALVVAGIGLAFPVVVLFIEIVAACLARPASAPNAVRRPSMAILVPAHDEALGIVATVEGIRPQLSATDRLLVVADNCTDATADLARRAGAEVVERVDSSRRGKAFALDYGLRQLATAPPDIVVIVDADCTLAAGSLDTLASRVAATGRPVQAHYRLDPPSGAQSPYLLVATFAFMVKTFVRPLGLSRLGLPCPLQGTGMAFPWSLISRAELASSEIVEDLVLGLELARAGHPPLFCPEALVHSSFPTSSEGQQTQRTRWETGHLNVVFNRLPGLLVEAVRTRNMPLLAMVADAAVPPMAFLALLLMGYAALAVLMLILAGHVAPAVIALSTIVVFSLCIALAWFRVGRGVISVVAVALAPFYLLSKLGLYSRILIGRKVGWVRSRRD